MGLRALNPPDGDFAKLDASFSLNGLTLTRSTNNISDAVTGVTLNLKKVGLASVNVTQSTDVENKLRGFLNAYNAVQDFVAGQYKKDAKNRPTGILAGVMIDTSKVIKTPDIKDETLPEKSEKFGFGQLLLIIIGLLICLILSVVLIIYLLG